LIQAAVLYKHFVCTCYLLKVYVRVLNNLQTDAASIHWHGINMKGSNATGGVATPWADGVSYVTQCPISPGAIFTYKYYTYNRISGLQTASSN